MPTHTLTREPVIAYIALGANLGDARAAVVSAIEQIASSAGVQWMAQSSLYKTAPIDSTGDDYINAVVKVLSTLPAYSLMSLLQNIEQTAGRERPYRNAPRTLDLDLLLYGNAQIQSKSLTIPHPRMHERAFVLLPLQEIAPGLVSDQALDAVKNQRIERFN